MMALLSVDLVRGIDNIAESRGGGMSLPYLSSQPTDDFGPAARCRSTRGLPKSPKEVNCRRGKRERQF
jgi:hypothetical protein